MATYLGPEYELLIEIVPMGNLANRIIQYLVALEIQERVPSAILSNVRLPELDIVAPLLEVNVPAQESLTIYDDEYIDVETIVVLVRQRAIRHLRIFNYCQRIGNFLSLDRTRELVSALSSKAGDVTTFDDSHIVINIRAAEVLDGILHYPLLPIGFYADLVRRSGKKPVFMGQLDGSDYCTALRAEFPKAIVLPSAGYANDFETMRRAGHLVLSVSTFTWLAGWTSHASTIDLPMAGLFNRLWREDTDLLPLDDERYRFWSFPLYFGMPSPEFLLFQGRLQDRWRQEDPRKIKAMEANRPILEENIVDEASITDPYVAGIFYQYDYKPKKYLGQYNALFRRPAPEERRVSDFDSYFYCHEYQDAAADISLGWYRDALHHYLSAGRRMGYRARQRDWPNVSRGKPAFLSSVASEADDGPLAEQARRFSDCGVAKGFAFRTEREQDPWWMVDLGSEHEITDIYIYNRNDVAGVAGSAAPLDIEFSSDGTTWIRMHRCPDDRPFAIQVDPGLLRWYPRPSVSSRFVRLIVRRMTVLHLRSIEVFGRPLEKDAGA